MALQCIGELAGVFISPALFYLYYKVCATLHFFRMPYLVASKLKVVWWSVKLIYSFASCTVQSSWCSQLFAHGCCCRFRVAIGLASQVPPTRSLMLLVTSAWLESSTKAYVHPLIVSQSRLPHSPAGSGFTTSSVGTNLAGLQQLASSNAYVSSNANARNDALQVGNLPHNCLVISAICFFGGLAMCAFR